MPVDQDPFTVTLYASSHYHFPSLYTIHIGDQTSEPPNTVRTLLDIVRSHYCTCLPENVSGLVLIAFSIVASAYVEPSA